MCRKEFHPLYLLLVHPLEWLWHFLNRTSHLLVPGSHTFPASSLCCEWLSPLVQHPFITIPLSLQKHCTIFLLCILFFHPVCNVKKKTCSFLHPSSMFVIYTLCLNTSTFSLIGGSGDLWNVLVWGKDSLEACWTIHANMQMVIDLFHPLCNRTAVFAVDRWGLIKRK